MTTTAPSMSRWVILRQRSRADLAGGAALWAGFLAFVLIATFVVSGFRPVTVSGWDMASQLARWYAGGLGVYFTAVYLPLYIAHGLTRRSFAIQTAPFAVAFALLLGSLMAVGYLVELAVYRIAGWTQTLTQEHLFDAPTQFGLATLEFTVVFAVWMTAGTLVGAAFYRDPGLGLLSIPLGLAMLGAIESATGPDKFPLVGSMLSRVGIHVDQATPAGAVAVAAGLVVIGGALTWVLIRDLPMRNKGT